MHFFLPAVCPCTHLMPNMNNNNHYHVAMLLQADMLATSGWGPSPPLLFRDRDVASLMHARRR